jgi:hypothetical protein
MKTRDEVAQERLNQLTQQRKWAHGKWFRFNLSFAKKLPKAAPKTQHIDKATQIAGQESLNLPGSQAGQRQSGEQGMKDVVGCLALL